MEGEFSFNSCVRGFHIYRDIWTPALDKTLECEQQTGNPHDRYAVSTIRQGAIVGHVPKKISRLCSLFLGRGGSITATITGVRQRSYDLPQGGLEIPCKLFFRGSEKLVGTVQQFVCELQLDQLDDILNQGGSDNKGIAQVTEREASGQDTSSEETIPPAKVDLLPHHQFEEMSMAPWVQFEKFTLTLEDKKILVEGRKLSDNVINFAQLLLRHQFPDLNGLHNTHYLNKPELSGQFCDAIQIIFCRSDHWIVASTLRAELNAVTIYDSSYSDCSSDTISVLMHMMGNKDPRITMGHVQQQVGGADCGVFAIAVATSLAFGCYGPYHFHQHSTREHLVGCIERLELLPFHQF